MAKVFVSGIDVAKGRSTVWVKSCGTKINTIDGTWILI